LWEGREKTIAHNHFQFNVIMCNLSAMSTKHSVSHVSVICLSSRGVVKGDLKNRPLLFINIVQYLPILQYLVKVSTNEILELHSEIFVSIKKSKKKISIITLKLTYEFVKFRANIFWMYCIQYFVIFKCFSKNLKKISILNTLFHP